MSLSLDTVKPRQTAIYSSSSVLFIFIYFHLSLIFFLLLPFSYAACCLKYPRHSLCLALLHIKHTKPQHKNTNTYLCKHAHTHTHTLMKCPISSCPCFISLFSLLSPIPIIIPLSFSFPLWLSVRMDVSAGDSWNLIHSGMERGRQGERKTERMRGMRGLVCRAQ